MILAKGVWRDVEVVMLISETGEEEVHREATIGFTVDGEILISRRDVGTEIQDAKEVEAGVTIEVSVQVVIVPLGHLTPLSQATAPGHLL